MRRCTKQSVILLRYRSLLQSYTISMGKLPALLSGGEGVSGFFPAGKKQHISGYEPPQMNQVSWAALIYTSQALSSLSQHPGVLT